MFHVKQPGVPVEHFGAPHEPDWRVESRPDGTFYWIVTDWHGEPIASGIRVGLTDAIGECVRWAQ